MPLAIGLESMPTLPPSRRFMRLALRRRKWLLGPLVRSTLPDPEMWKRFLAPLWVFNLGIVQLCNTRPCGLHMDAYRIPFREVLGDGSGRRQTVWATGSAASDFVAAPFSRLWR